VDNPRRFFGRRLRHAQLYGQEGNYSIESAATTNEAAQQGAIGSASQNPALKARSSKAQGASPGTRAWSGISPERAAQLRSFAASPFQGFYHGCSNPGFRAAAQPSPGLWLLRAFSAGFTHMPSGAGILTRTSDCAQHKVYFDAQSTVKNQSLRLRESKTRNVTTLYGLGRKIIFRP